MDTENADVIITNHAMVSADLEKSHILPTPERTLHILDEAHHLVENFHGTMERSLHFESVYEICSRYADALAHGVAMAADIADLPDCKIHLVSAPFPVETSIGSNSRQRVIPSTLCTAIEQLLPMKDLCRVELPW